MQHICVLGSALIVVRAYSAAADFGLGRYVDVRFDRAYVSLQAHSRMHVHNAEFKRIPLPHGGGP